MHGWVCSLSNHCTAVAIFGLVASQNGELKTLESYKSLADIIVRLGIDCTPLGIAEKFVQSIVSGAFSNFVIGGVGHLGIVDGVVNGAIGRILRRTAIETRWSTWGVAVSGSGIHTGSRVIVISTGCSGKRLQVSDQFS